MKLTSEKLKELIREGLEETGAPMVSDPALLKALKKLTKGLESLDVSIDYLSAAMTGESPLSIGIGQKIMGRYRTPTKRPGPPVQEGYESLDMAEYLEQVIDEELAKVF